MSTAGHGLRCEAEGYGERLLVCDTCGRRLVAGPGKLVVLDQGDMRASHCWSNVPGLSLSTGIEQA